MNVSAQLNSDNANPNKAKEKTSIKYQKSIDKSQNPNKAAAEPTHAKQIQHTKHIEAVIENQLSQTIQQVQVSESSKNAVFTSPQPSIRRKMRLRSYQLYKEQQRSLKSSHKNRISQWKARFLIIRSKQDKINQNANNDLQPINLTPKPSNDFFKQREENSFRSSYLNASSERHSSIQNNDTLKKLKSKVQFYSLSAIIANSWAAITSMSPYIKAQAVLVQPQEGGQLIKNGKAFKIRPYLRQFYLPVTAKDTNSPLSKPGCARLLLDSHV